MNRNKAYKKAKLTNLSYFARDYNGQWNAYENEPFSFDVEWIPRGGIIAPLCKAGNKDYNNWKDTLEKL